MRMRAVLSGAQNLCAGMRINFACQNAGAILYLVNKAAADAGIAQQIALSR